MLHIKVDLVQIMKKELARAYKKVFDRREIVTSASYYKDDIGKRDKFLQLVYADILNGKNWLNAINNPSSIFHGERVAEYALIASKLLELKPEKIIDVGCVLNNPIISEYVLNQAKRIYFLNPSLEPVIYPWYGYFKFALDQWDLDLQFPLVTCLSTLEHIGFDNTRYGVNQLDEGWGWEECIENILKSIGKLISMTAPKGTMIASCPFGQKEFVLHPPAHGVRTAQVLHSQHVDALRSAFGKNLEIITLRLAHEGWVISSPSDEYENYGAIGPGASGLIIIIWQGDR